MSKFLSQVAAFLNTQIGKVTINDENIPVRVHNNKTCVGYLNIIEALVTESKSDLLGEKGIEAAEVRQWLEYGVVYVSHNDSLQNTQILNELNAVLATRTYLVSYKLTIADVFIFYLLLNLMINLSYTEKENYIHVSRWFDNLQQDSTLRQSNKLIDFSTNYLVSIAPARH